VLQSVAVCSNMLQCVAVFCSVLQWYWYGYARYAYCSVLQSVAVCCSALQSVAVVPVWVCQVCVLQCLAVFRGV